MADPILETNKKLCPVCQCDAVVVNFDHDERRRVDCPACGKFVITKTAKKFATENKEIGAAWRSILSYWISNKQNMRREIEIDLELVKLILKETNLPSHRIQADNLVRYLGDNLKSPEQYLSLNHSLVAAKIGANRLQGVNYIIEYLINKKYIEVYSTVDKKGGTANSKSDRLRLTFEGWDRYETLKYKESEGRTAFIAMQFNDPKHDEIYFKCFKPAVRQTGFELRRLDEVLAAGLIDNQMRVEIRNSRFLLADLTNDNLGAYWEAGYAEGLGMPVIYLCEKNHFEKFKTHFDTNHHTTIVWDENDLETTTRNLKNTIRATVPLDAIMVDEENTN